MRRAEFPPFVYEPPPPAVVIERTRPPEPEAVVPPPPRTRTGGGETDIAVLDVSPVPFVPTRALDGPMRGIADGDFLPIVTVAPHYPPAAERRELEGYVIVAFTINANGAVGNLRVAESSNGVFERAALDAVARFRFRPRVIDGRPVAVDGVRWRITFTLDR